MRGSLFRLRAVLKGRQVRIGPGLELYTRLDIRGQGTVQIGARCVVGGISGDRSQFVVLTTHSPDAQLVIGDDARLFAARVSSKHSIVVGSHALIEDAGIMDTDFHSLGDHGRAPEHETLDRCRIVIGDRVSIGARSLVLKGVRIGDDVIVGPGAVVSRSLADATFALGNPARAYATRPTGTDTAPS